MFRKLSYSALLSSRSRKSLVPPQQFTSQCYILPNTNYTLFPTKNWLTFGLRRISQSYPFLSLVPIDMETLLLLTHNSSAWKSVFISVCWSTPGEIFKDDEKPRLSILLLYSFLYLGFSLSRYLGRIKIQRFKMSDDSRLFTAHSFGQLTRLIRTLGG